MGAILYRVQSLVLGENVFEIMENGSIRCFEINTSVNSSDIPDNCKLVIKDSNGDSVFGVDLYGSVYIADTVHAFAAIPFVYDISPIDGSVDGGDTIVITGSNFEGNAVVKLGGVACTSVVIDSSTQITCVTPAGSAGSAALRVTNTHQGFFQIDSAFIFREAPTPDPGPEVDAVDPAFGTEGTEVILSGENFFGYVGGEPTVAVGDLNSAGGLDNEVACTGVVFYNSSKIVCRMPAKTNGTYTIQITFADGQLATYEDGFAYVTAPTVTSVAPYFGLVTGGESIVITGIDFTDDATVTIGGRAATSVSVSSSGTEIDCKTPRHRREELADIVVTNESSSGGGAAGTLRDSFEYVSQDSTTLADAAGADVAEFATSSGQVVLFITSLGEMVLSDQVDIGFGA